MSDDDTTNDDADEATDRMAHVRAVNSELRRRREQRGQAQIPERRPQPQRSIDECDLVAYTSKITYNGRGDVVWTVVIPHQYREMADALPSTYGTPLHVTVQKWRPLGVVETAE